MSAGSIAITQERAEQGLRWVTLTRLAPAVVQLGLAVLVIRLFQIESRGFYHLALLTFAGFTIHALLPFAYRLPFFVALSIAGTLLVLGVASGLWVIGIGAGLIGICHLPVRFSFRLSLVLAAGALLAFFRASLLPSGIPAPVWPILASMFMFRLAIYLYDLKHKVEAGTPARVMAYFFMIPNAAFPLFPVVDYKTFVRTYYDQDEWRIYQRGMSWILRGLLHLLAYRFIYHYLTLDLTEVRTGPAMVQYIFSSFMLYLRVSGMYHVAVGVLHLFGFRLPETNHYWLFCQSFTDLWRRMNIYFKDFMMKLVYYPSFFRLRRRGMRQGIALALVAVFFVTWALHAVQWFWLRGGLLLSFQDGLFYVILGSLVIYQSLKEARPGPRKPVLAAAGFWNWRRARNALLTMGTLMVLWSFWTADSADQWLAMWSSVREWPATPTLVVLASLALYLLLAGLPWSGPELAGKKETSLLRPSLLTTGAFAGLLVAGQPRVYQHLNPKAVTVAKTLQENRLNSRDNAILLRGYYEKVDDKSQISGQVWEVAQGRPDDARITSTEFFHERSDFLGGELVPSAHATFKEREFVTNRWGMHDREYALEKPAGTYRVSLLGPSDVMGPGVGEDQTFEALVEERLNREHAGFTHARYEILNFGVAAFTVLQQAAMLDDRALTFAPDLVVVTYHPASDPPTALRYMVSTALHGTAIPYPDLDSLVRKAGIAPAMKEAQAKRQMWPYAMDLMRWSFRRMAAVCREKNIPIVLLVVDAINEPSEQQQPLIQYADSLGYYVIDLRKAHEGHEQKTIVLAEWDRHPNVLGHRLLADALYNRLLSLNDMLGLGLRPGSAVSLSNQEEQ